MRNEESVHENQMDTGIATYNQIWFLRYRTGEEKKEFLKDLTQTRSSEGERSRRKAQVTCFTRFATLHLLEIGSRLENKSLTTWPCKQVWNLSKWALGSFSPDIAIILHFWSNLSLVNVKHGRRSQVIHEVIEWPGHSIDAFGNRLDII